MNPNRRKLLKLLGITPALPIAAKLAASPSDPVRITSLEEAKRIARRERYRVAYGGAAPVDEYLNCSEGERIIIDTIKRNRSAAINTLQEPSPILEQLPWEQV